MEPPLEALRGPTDELLLRELPLPPETPTHTSSGAPRPDAGSVAAVPPPLAALPASSSDDTRGPSAAERTAAAAVTPRAAADVPHVLDNVPSTSDRTDEWMPPRAAAGLLTLPATSVRRHVAGADVDATMDEAVPAVAIAASAAALPGSH
jgi:hypothetical protein